MACKYIYNSNNELTDVLNENGTHSVNFSKLVNSILTQNTEESLVIQNKIDRIVDDLKNKGINYSEINNEPLLTIRDSTGKEYSLDSDLTPVLGKDYDIVIKSKEGETTITQGSLPINKETIGGNINRGILEGYIKPIKTRINNVTSKFVGKGTSAIERIQNAVSFKTNLEQSFAKVLTIDDYGRFDVNTNQKSGSVETASENKVFVDQGRVIKQLTIEEIGTGVNQELMRLSNLKTPDVRFAIDNPDYVVEVVPDPQRENEETFDKMIVDRLGKKLVKKPNRMSKEESDMYNYITLKGIVNNMESGYALPNIGSQTHPDVEIDTEILRQNIGREEAIPTVNLRDLEGIPFMFGISDELRTGDFVNPYSGNTLTRMEGGLGFNSTETHKDFHWANVEKHGAVSQLATAINIYKANTELFNKAWDEGRLPYGQVPVAIAKMSESAIDSNEAVLRLIQDTFSKDKVLTLKKNQKKLVKSIQNTIDENSKDNKKDSYKWKVLNSLFHNYKMESVQDILDTVINHRDEAVLIDEKGKTNELSLDAIKFMSSIFLTSSSEFRKTAKELGSNVDLNINKVREVLKEPAFNEYVGTRDIISVVGIDVLNPSVKVTQHPHYPYGLHGGLIGVLEKPVNIFDAFSNMKSSAYAQLFEKSQGFGLSKILGWGMPTGMGLTNTLFRGDKVNFNPTQLTELAAFVRTALPGINFELTQEGWNYALEKNKDNPQFKDVEGNIQGFTDGKTIYVNPSVDANKVLIHEAGHIWGDILKQTASGREFWNRGLDLVEGTKALEQAIEKYGDTPLAREEALVELIATKADSILNKSDKKTFMDWLFDAWKYIVSTFKSSGVIMSTIPMEEVTLSDFVGAAVYDLLSGKAFDTNVGQYGLRNKEDLGTRFSIENKSKNTQEFFSDAVTGGHAPIKDWQPILDYTPQEQQFAEEFYDKHMGNFDTHIATNIPTFRETQIKVGNAILNQGRKPDVANSELIDLKNRYIKSAGLKDVRPIYSKIKPSLFKEIADYHKNVPDDRHNLVMKESYEAFMEETLAQFNMLVDAGYKIEPWLKEGEPYGVESDRIRKDISENKQLFYLRSRSATGEDSQNESADNYLPFRSTGIRIQGDDVLYNDLFRAVHDIFGHGAVKNSFSAQGELDAYTFHSSMYSEKAQKALFLETVVYNAWYKENKNYGPRKIYDVPQSFIDETRKGALMYDIGGSEGGFVKAITDASGGTINTINLDVNKDMMDSHNSSPVKGSTFVNEAFYEGFDEFNKHVPTEKADIVHESMVFQFINEDRVNFIQEIVDNYVKEDGLVILEEKVTPQTEEQWLESERVKDNYKSQYYSQEYIKKKDEVILTGMKKNQTPYTTLLSNLRAKFKYVQEFWDAGNFKGVVASNDESQVKKFNDNLGGKIVSEYSEINNDVRRYTPEEVVQTTDAVQYAEAMQKAINNREVDGAQVEKLSVESVQDKMNQGYKFFMTDDGMSGAYVAPDGYMGGLFKDPTSGRTAAAAVLQDVRVQNGGKFFDAYATHLEEIYIKNNFIPYRRLSFVEEYAPEGWQKTSLKDRPDVVFFYYNPQIDVSNINKIKGTGEYTTDYDEAYAATANISATQNTQDIPSGLLERIKNDLYNQDIIQDKC